MADRCAFRRAIDKNTELILGAHNLFDVYPDRNEFNDLFGTFLSDLAGVPFSNITDRSGNVIPGTDSHGIFPYGPNIAVRYQRRILLRAVQRPLLGTGLQGRITGRPGNCGGAPTRLASAEIPQSAADAGQ